MRMLSSDMTDRPSRLVGILGGMGPAATADFYTKLVRLTPASRDQDHVRVVVWADPTVPSRQDALLSGGEDPKPALRQGISYLLGCGAEILISPCNTAHAFLPAIVPEFPVEFISIVDSTVDAVRASTARGAVGLLATDGALASGIYQVALGAAGFSTTVLSEGSQAALMEIVHSVKAGHEDATARVHDLVAEVVAKGASTVIAACTELSTLIDDGWSGEGALVVDPAVALARATIRRAQGAPVP